MEEGVVTDAPSRNALYKVHVSLGKIVNALDDQQPQRLSRSSSAVPENQPSDGRPVAEEPVIKEEDEYSDNTVIAKHNRSTPSNAEISDEDDDMEG